MNRKKSFILFADYIIHVSRLPDEAAGRLFKGILQYAKEGIDPQFPPTADAAADAAVDMAFSFIKLQLSRDLEKYEAVSQRRAEAGRLGGLKTQANRRKQMLANEADNENENENEPVTGTETAPPAFTGIFSGAVGGEKQ